MRPRLKLFFTVILPLLFGSFIYIHYRATSLIMFRWFDTLGLSSVIGWIRRWPLPPHPPSWLIFSLPDALWVYAFTSLMLLIWHYRITPASIGWIALAPVIGIGSELGQAIKIVPGTFDLTDLMLLVIASVLPFINGDLYRSVLTLTKAK